MREMRRIRQALSKEECETILKENTSGVLSVLGDDDYPYGVPLSYVYADGKLFFHSAKEGHKIDAINKNGKASFCVIAQDQVVPEKYTTYFHSVIAFGKARILADAAEKRYAIELLAEKYMPELEDGRMQEISREFERFCMIELTVEAMTGKEAIELTRARQ